MAVYPNNIYDADTVAPNTPRVGHASLHDAEQNEVVAIETYAGVENSTVNNTLDYMVRHGWINDPNTPTYGSTTEFSVTGNRTNFYTAGRKVRFNDSIYATTVSSTYVSASNLTNVIVDNAVVPNPINSLDYGVYSDGATQINGEYAIESGTITSTQISSSAGITGSQIISGVSLAGQPVVGGVPKLASGNQAYVYIGLQITPGGGGSTGVGGAWNVVLTNVPSSVTQTIYDLYGGTLNNLVLFPQIFGVAQNYNTSSGTNLGAFSGNLSVGN